MKVLGFIPARGGSKGLPGKNIRPLDGRPMIWYTLAAAERSCLERIVVSSDDSQILETAAAYFETCAPHSRSRLNLHRRPANIAADASQIVDAVAHFISEHADETNQFDAVMILQPTSPVRAPEHIDECIQLLASNAEATTCVSVAQPLQHPSDMIRRTVRGYELYISGEGKSGRQDYEDLLFITGAHYLARLDFLMKTKKFFEETSLLYEIDAFYSVDVDTAADFKIAEACIAYIRQH